MRKFFILTIAFFFIALICTLLGGLILAYDRSLWPIDGYVLYVGQYSHCLTILSSAYTLVSGLKKSTPKYQVAISAFIFISSITTMAFTWHAFFNYGIWPSAT